jgi:hypothetical protein
MFSPKIVRGVLVGAVVGTAIVGGSDIAAAEDDGGGAPQARALPSVSYVTPGEETTRWRCWGG